MRSTYPEVVSEFPTLDAMREGASIARFGDGELKLLDGVASMREVGNKRMAEELRAILTAPARGLLPAIPTMDPYGPKFMNWIRHSKRFQKTLALGVTYYSAFITRPDSAPWIACRGFAEAFERLWRGKDVVLVAKDPSCAIARLVERSASAMILVQCPANDAYSAIDALERDVLYYRTEKREPVVLLSAGGTATCLAARLHKRGLQALDVGSAGAFLARELYGKSKEVKCSTE